MTRHLLSASIYVMTSLMGVAAFLYPFWLPAVAAQNNVGLAHAGDAPLVLTLLAGCAFAVLLLEVQDVAANAKVVALLGVLVAINSVLRFAEVAIPGPGGFSPIFLLIVLTGYVFGGRMGFLMGALTLFVSGIITGSAGPWLPYQMFTAGWMGMSAVLCRPLVRLLGGEGKWTEVALLALFAGIWGLLYGAVMNIWFWPYLTASDGGGPGLYWSPGMSIAMTLRRFGAFYLATSLLWDLMRFGGNVALMLVAGMPVLRVLRRFRRRFIFVYRPAPTPTEESRPVATAAYRKAAA
ncbi:MAG: ECF transporter S component [Caldilineaceae bacterium]|nr:ECF transporter S component [Caldilineaceae bacterium]